MGKTEEEQNPPERPGGEASERNAEQGLRCSRWISGLVGARCVLFLVLSVALFLSAIFWLPPFLQFADREGADPDSIFKGHDIVASFLVKNPVSVLNENAVQLEADIFGEVGFATTKVVLLSLERLPGSNITRVIFAIDPVMKAAKISPMARSLIRESFESLLINQSTLRLTESLFGQPYLFEVLKFPGGITVIPHQSGFLLQKLQPLCNFSLNFSIQQVETNFDELTTQLKNGMHLASYENLYVKFSNSRGSTVAPPTIVDASVLLAVGNAPSKLRLKQIAQTIAGSNTRNLGLNDTVFGRVKQVRLSLDLEHSLHGGGGSASSPSPSPAPQPQGHHHHHHHHHHCHHHHRHCHHHENDHLAPAPGPEPESHKGSHGVHISPGPAPKRKSPRKTYNAKPPCPSVNKKWPRGKPREKNRPLAPSIAPGASPPYASASPHHNRDPPAPAPMHPSHSNTASGPLPNVAFAHAQPPSKSELGRRRSNAMPIISPSPSTSSAGDSTVIWAALPIVLIAIFHP